MANDYTKEIHEMIDFAEENELICYRTISSYAYNYNREWYNALHSRYTKRFIYAMFEGIRRKRKQAGTLPQYDPFYFMEEYEKLLEKLRDNNIKLVEWHNEIL